MNRLPEPEVIELCNADLERPETWEPWTGPNERAPLPGHEHDTDDKFLPWLTERRAFGLAWACALLAVVIRLDLSGFLAVSIFAGCGLLPIIGAVLADMRKDMKPKSADAALLGTLAELDDLNAYAERIHARMYADGILPERRKENRNA